MYSHSEKARVTYKYDCIRGAFEGVIFSGLMTFGLLIAIREFGAPAWIKSFLSINGGRLITPLFLILGYRSCLAASRVCSLVLLATALFLFLVPFSHSLWFYAICVFMAYIFFAQPPPMMIQVYSQNYTPKERGSRVSSIFVLSTTFGAIFADFGGKLLDADFSNFRILFIIMAICGLIASWSLNKIPSEPLVKTETDDSNFWRNLKLAWKDKLFGWLLLAFILLTLGNSIAMPVRIEYLAQEKYGIDASNEIIALLVYGVPAILIILTIKLWGFIFDYLRFVTTRILSNICFIASFIMFFSTEDIYWLVVASILNGIGVAGHIVMWHLWVTKIAPKHKVAAYMTVHTSLSGFKGILAPFIGYYLLHITTPLVVSYICVALFALSCLMLACVWNQERIR
ncbi:MAG: hypothetical protein COZ46_05480 [Verrucomicrobia bacterium CG_4_10_14_3_um_filter_43_23]|nr:MAG: hypothetical protein AUJ82_06840 [Verrucomicrobia bacterium CG1_02_43_26]PIX58115.1 MAG: hypothetical protein COZ46_05480 [Verrucomicrobia bacterium CG_4_10_14_3_um_filter_43_23]PIY61476.1 MAG: hypothetical protein COY94_05105 [Verrucomicrobia bacterium CG_4_10_14_0_8_um_filter_43_34]PJA43995.1 MAG: hypothetical protein CO175_05115 [Verrucomicrobia bacterium CG_4_9_14_3_um_filter_43_20]